MFAICPRVTDDNFGDILQLWDELARPAYDPREVRALRNAQYLSQLANLRDTEVQNTDKYVTYCLNLQHFSPEEVKISSDNHRITVTAKHEEKEDKHGFVSREMTRIYTLPPDVDPKSVTSTMNSKGILMIRANKQALEAPKEVSIPIEFKG